MSAPRVGIIISVSAAPIREADHAVSLPPYAQEPAHV
jgi:hypothetical protein